MLICEEAWHSLPATILAVGGAELILVVSASPARDFTPSAGGRPRNLERWEQLAPAMAIEHGIFVAVAQLAGSEGGKLFPGGSIAVGPEGEILARGPLLEEAFTTAALDATAIDRARAATPLLSDLEQMLPHLERSLRFAVDGSTIDQDTGMFCAPVFVLGCHLNRGEGASQGVLSHTRPERDRRIGSLRPKESRVRKSLFSHWNS